MYSRMRFEEKFLLVQKVATIFKDDIWVQGLFLIRPNTLLPS